MIGGMGLADLEKLMGNVIQTAERQDIPAHVRDGYIMMYIFLPVVFKEDFKQYIGPILPSILQVGELICVFDHIVLRKAKIAYNFGLFECNRVKKVANSA